MPDTSRRFFLKTAVALPLAGILANCAGQTLASISAQAATDINLIGSGLASSLPALAQSGLVSGSALVTVQSDVAKVASIASAVSSATSQSTGQNAVQQIETLVNGVVSTLAGLSLPAPFGPALNAAEVLLPVVEVAVGLVTANLTAAMAPNAMTPDQARLVLAAVAAK